MKLGTLHKFAFCVGTAMLLGGALAYPDAAYAAKDTKGKKAENQFPNATRKDPKVSMSEGVQRKLNKAFDLIQEDKLDDAQKLIDEVLADGKKTPYAEALALQTKGQILWQKDDYPGAIDALKKAIAMDAMPNSNQFPAMYQLAQLYLMQEKYNESLAAADDYIKQSGNASADVLALKGNDLYRLEKYPEAVVILKEAIAKAEKPNDSWRQILMASLFEMNDYAEAAKIAEADLAKDPNNKKVIQQLSSIYINGKQEAKAMELMASAKAKGLFTTEDDYKQLAQLYNYADKPKEAAAALEEGVQKGIVKNNYDVYKLLGDSYSLSDQEEKAVEAYGKASPLAKDGEADFLRGQMLINLQRWAEAKDAMTKALERGVKRVGAANVLLGNALNELGDRAGAIAAMKKAAAYDETKAMASAWLKSIESGATVKVKAPPKAVPQKKK